MGRKPLVSFLLALVSWASYGQILDPVHWKARVSAAHSDTIIVDFIARLEPAWHLYGPDIPEGGPQATQVEWRQLHDVQPIGHPQFMTPLIEVYDSFFEMNLTLAEDSAVIRQIFLRTGKAPRVEGIVRFMVCDTMNCLPPDELAFAIPLGADTVIDLEEESVTSPIPEQAQVEVEEAQIGPIEPRSRMVSLWAIFLGGFIGGLIALLTPCVFPMLPLTVSYFTKQAEKGKGILRALGYGLSIVIIYVGLGFIVTKLFGADAMNQMASNGFLNMLFFILFVLFAISFFGAFEIRLPSSWANAADRWAATTGGWLGIFFMAFTLAIVSFSCTGPIIGTLLVEAALSGATWGPVVGMLGFAIALALPFTLLALFPQVLQQMPRSGAWMNTVKISLGFIELALAMKFLSNVDLAYRWNILNREIFLAIWVVIFATWALFLLGVIRIKDADAGPIGVGRLLFGMLVLAFAVYLLPGLWGAPLRVLSGLAPPDFYREWKPEERLIQQLHRASIDINPNTNQRTEVAVAQPENCAQGLPCYHDLATAIEVAKATGKPLLLDFTGWTCVNCRKMEEHVWSHPEVWSLLANEFVLASLYVDEKSPLPVSERYVSPKTGEKITTVGEKWTDLQISLFGSNSQPYYVIMAPDSTVLVSPRGYTPDVDEFKQFLESGLAKWKEYQRQQISLSEAGLNW